MVPPGPHFSRIVVAVAVAALVALGSVADAQANDTGSLSGAVSLRQTGAPISGVTVRIHQAVGAFQILSTTDQAGRYSVIGLEPGKYTIFFEKTGLQTAEYTGVEICPGARTSIDAFMNDRSHFTEFYDNLGDRRLYTVLSTSTTIVFNQWPGIPSLRCL
jgi:hypothetical protein